MDLRYLPGMPTLSYDEKKCKGCGRCTEVCPHQVFEMAEKRAKEVDRDACIECGACMKNCPFGAIYVNAGVGCALAIISAKNRTTAKPSCGCSKDGDCC